MSISLTERIKQKIAQTKAEKNLKERELREKIERKKQSRSEYYKKVLQNNDSIIFNAEELDQSYVEGLKRASDEVAQVHDNGKIKIKVKPSQKSKHQKLERLHKVIARTGITSVRKAEQMIIDGLVSVNGEKATVGQKVNILDRSLKIRVNGQIIQHSQANDLSCRVIIYNKAEGEISTRFDPEGRVTVFDRLPRLKLGRWIQIGRLDANTSGLLLFTNDGELAHRLMHPSYEIERKYLCRIYGEVTPQKLLNLKKGVMLEDGLAKFESIKELHRNSLDNENQKGKSNEWFEVSLSEGRNHEVRRLWETQNLIVSRLIRTEYAGIKLNRELSIPTSGYLEADLNEINLLRGMVGLKPETKGFRPADYGQSKSELKRQKQKHLKTIRGAIKKDKSHRKSTGRIYDDKTLEKREKRAQLVNQISFANKQKFSNKFNENAEYTSFDSNKKNDAGKIFVEKFHAKPKK